MQIDYKKIAQDLLNDSKMALVAWLPGGSDLIGFTQVTVTPEMVGKRIAIFTAIEGKTKKLKATKEQQNFINQVRLSGGLAGVARNLEEAQTILEGVSNG